MEVDKYMKLHQNTLLDYKNEKFERVNLKSKYDQSLTIIDKKNKNERNMGI